MVVEAIVSKLSTRGSWDGRPLSVAFSCEMDHGLSRRLLAKNAEAKVQEVRLLYDWRGWLFPSISSTHVK